MLVYALIAGTILCTVAGQLFAKAAMLRVGAVPTELDRLPSFFVTAFLQWRTWVGLILSLFGGLFWLATVSRSSVSFAYPFMGLAIVLVLALSPALFGEVVPLTRWLGVALVCAGLWVAAQGP